MINLPLPSSPSIVAYIDAGTATIIVQFLVAGAVAGLFFVRGWWRKIKVLFTKLFRSKR